MRIMHPVKYVCRVSSFSYPPRFCKPMSTCCENGLQVAGRTIKLQFGSHSLAVVKQWRPESTMSRISIFPPVFPEHFQWRSSVCALCTERNICGGAAPRPPPPVLPPSLLLFALLPMPDNDSSATTDGLYGFARACKGNLSDPPRFSPPSAKTPPPAARPAENGMERR